MLKCAHRLISLFLTDPANFQMYVNATPSNPGKMNAVQKCLVLASFRIAWILLNQNTLEEGPEIRKYFGDDEDEYEAVSNLFQMIEYKLLKYPVQRCMDYMDMEATPCGQYKDKLIELAEKQFEGNVSEDIMGYIDDMVKVRESFSSLCSW